MKKFCCLFFLFFVCALFPLSSPCFSENKKADSPPPLPAQELFFTFQVQSVANKEPAHALENRLVRKGYPAYVTQSLDKTGKQFYQIRIGKFSTRKEAEASARLFYTREKMAYWITAASGTQRASSTTTTMNAGAPAGSPDNAPGKVPAPAAAKEPAAQTESLSGIEKVPDEEKYLDLENTAPETRKQESAQPSEQPPPAAREQEDTSRQQSVTRMYTYRGPQGSLHVTNTLDNIPNEFRDAIESISLFPVKVISFNQKKKVLLLDCEGKELEVKLLGISIPSAAVAGSVSTYVDKKLKGAPLRLKYIPGRSGDKDRILSGSLYFRQGTPVNLEMLMQGIAPYDTGHSPVSQQKVFTEAEAFARKEKAGIWAGQ